MEEWAGIYKFARLAFLALTLLGIGIWVYWPTHRARFEEPAVRMLSDDDLEEMDR
jgi:cbb3-type cytochrome oxidase subunit 3